MITTLVLTRKPNAIFQSPLFDTQSGRFGILLVLQGGEVTKVNVTPGASGGGGRISIPSGTLDILTSDGMGVKEIKRYTTIERMGGYVQLKPQHYNGKVYTDRPYGITYEPKNSAVIHLTGTGGQCFRVHGGITPQERGILIHEAPHVGWLTGCIGPRRYHDLSTGVSNTAHAAMEELFKIQPAPKALFVLDW
jgi:hypothetical protein